MPKLEIKEKCMCLCLDVCITEERTYIWKLSKETVHYIEIIRYKLNKTNVHGWRISYKWQSDGYQRILYININFLKNWKEIKSISTCFMRKLIKATTKKIVLIYCVVLKIF